MLIIKEKKITKRKQTKNRNQKTKQKIPRTERKNLLVGEQKIKEWKVSVSVFTPGSQII